VKPLFPLALALGAMALTGCAQGNLRTPGSYAALAPRRVGPGNLTPSLSQIRT